MLGALLYVTIYKNKCGQQPFSPYNPGKTLWYVYLFLFITHGWYSVAGIPMYYFVEAVLTYKMGKPKVSTNHNEASSSKRDHQRQQEQEVDKTRCKRQISWPELRDRLGTNMMIFLVKFNSHPIWRRILPYSFLIYIFHIVVVIERNKYILPPRIAAIKNAYINDGITDGCVALSKVGLQYNIPYIFIEGFRNWLITFLLCYIVNKIVVELPFAILKRLVTRIKKKPKQLQHHQRSVTPTMTKEVGSNQSLPSLLLPADSASSSNDYTRSISPTDVKSLERMA